MPNLRHPRPRRRGTRETVPVPCDLGEPSGSEPPRPRFSLLLSAITQQRTTTSNNVNVVAQRFLPAFAHSEVVRDSAAFSTAQDAARIRTSHATCQSGAIALHSKTLARRQ
jgi:hypothetical protein